MFGDNRSVDTSSTIPNSTTSKRHHLASYHQVREAIAAKYISFHWKDGKSNNRNMSKSEGWTLQSSLLTLWMEKTRVNNQTKIDDDVNLLKTL